MSLARVSRSRTRIALLAGGVLAACGLLAGAATGGDPGAPVQLPSTLDDFFLPGTQPDPDGLELEPIIASINCSFCHGDYYDPTDEVHIDDEPYNGWLGSLMAQSARDPIWHAALTIANQDSNLSGEYCIRCHAPGAWLAGKSDNADITDFEESFPTNDFDGVNCNFCHRVVNPVLEADSPIEDIPILDALAHPPGEVRGNARYVIDPADTRRGPYEDIAMNPDMNLHGVPVVYSPFHQKGQMCGTCHEVRNPMFIKNEKGDYELDTLGTPHATQDPLDMYPEQTTYSEWLESTFAQGGVQFDDGRFGGDHPTGLMQSCQDCHMPDQIAGGCFAWEFPPFFERQDLGQHTFLGVNTWALRAVRAVYDDSQTGLSQDIVDRAADRNADFLAAASDTLVQQVGDQLQVRVVNYSGHKLPTGYPEGRRIWVNVQFLDDTGELVAERGAYDYDTAELNHDTKVYEMKAGISDQTAAATNREPGESFHLVLNSVRLFDNRIPAIGFTNAAYEAFGGEPVGYSYEDGQYWDDTLYDIPAGTASALVTVYYQVMTKEYIEFLRDENVTDDRGTLVYDLWLDPTVGNKVPPVVMDSVAIDLSGGVPGDVTGDGLVNFTDILTLLAAWGPCPPPNFCPSDLDGDGDTDFNDLLVVLANWGV